MDKAQAKFFANQLSNEGEVGVWRVTKLLGHGKSAVVMRGERNGELPVAIKIFHPELVDRFGLEKQMERIAREQMLVGRDHPKAVKILGGGLSEPHKHPYIVMSLEVGEILSDCLNEIPVSKIKHIIAQIASVAKHLEDMGYAHRDIKPDNILVTSLENCDIKVLDFGVLRPLGASTLTDGPGHRPFIGTHQYSPPEMLHRKEESTTEAWRAISFYQIGAVLHDLINKKPLFDQFREPYAELVTAINEKHPEFSDSFQDRSLISLAKRCLTKNANERAKFVSWDEFLPTELVAEISLDERFRQLELSRKANLISKASTVFEEAEQNRLLQSGLKELVSNLQKKIQMSLSGLGASLPPRIINTSRSFYPLPTLTCKFVREKTLGFVKEFIVEISISPPENGSISEIYVREAQENQAELQWEVLCAVPKDFDGIQLPFELWLLSSLEKRMLF
jgi:serine/threonine protein kinase